MILIKVKKHPADLVIILEAHGSPFSSQIQVGKPQSQPLAEFKGKRKHMLMAVLGQGTEEGSVPQALLCRN